MRSEYDLQKREIQMTKPVCAVVGIGPQNGASFARRFASEGYAIALLSRKTEYSSKLAAELDSARVYACDVTDPSAVDAAFATIRAEMGEIDVLVYNAGSGVWGNIEELNRHGGRSRLAARRRRALPSGIPEWRSCRRCAEAC